MGRIQALPDERRRSGVRGDSADEPHPTGVPSRLQLLACAMVQ